MSGASREVCQLLEQAEKQGFEVTRTGSGHFKVVPSDSLRRSLEDAGFSMRANCAILASTPSDGRALQNSISDLRKIGFNYDTSQATKHGGVVVSKGIRNTLLGLLHEAGPKGLTAKEMAHRTGLPSKAVRDNLYPAMRGDNPEVIPGARRRSPVDQRRAIAFIHAVHVGRDGDLPQPPEAVRSITIPGNFTIGSGSTAVTITPEGTVSAETLAALDGAGLTMDPDGPEKTAQEVPEAPQEDAESGLCTDMREAIDLLLSLPLATLDDPRCRAEMRRLAPLVRAVSV